MPTQTLTLTASDFVDLQNAVGDRLNLGGPATAAQIKQLQIDFFVALVREYKRKQAIAAIVTTDIVPT